MIQDKIYSYFERNPQLKVLFVFDGTRDKLAELENAEWKPEYRFVVFKDNWFTIKYNLTHDWQEDKVVLMFEGVLPPHKNVNRAGSLINCLPVLVLYQKPMGQPPSTTSVVPLTKPAALEQRYTAAQPISSGLP